MYAFVGNLAKDLYYRGNLMIVLVNGLERQKIKSFL